MQSQIAKSALKTMTGPEQIESYKLGLPLVRAAGESGTDYLLGVAGQGIAEHPALAATMERRQQEIALEVAREKMGSMEDLQEAAFAKEQQALSGSPIASAAWWAVQKVGDLFPYLPAHTVGADAPGASMVNELKIQTKILQEQARRAPQAPKPENP